MKPPVHVLIGQAFFIPNLIGQLDGFFGIKLCQQEFQFFMSSFGKSVEYSLSNSIWAFDNGSDNSVMRYLLK